MQKSPLRFIIVGEAFCGKTSILCSFGENSFSEEYIPTVCDTHVTQVNINNSMLKADIVIVDTAGKENVDLRIHQYSEVDAVVLCFSIDSPDSLQRIQDTWLPEVHQYCPNVPFVLVGNKKDMRRTSMSFDLVPTGRGDEVANDIGAIAYVESSAKTREGICDIFEKIASVTFTSPAKKRRNCVIF